ncbi:hypothetical protein [Streptococcus equi]|uniref:hypothetical protein n=1 Tax=Streptococcus equi TaxID=1336 RepID=UPI001E47C45A|nr:hypothetical protein [Streptococcus equi]
MPNSCSSYTTDIASNNSCCSINSYLTGRKVAVDTAATVVGSNIGRVAGAAVGQMIIPIPGVGAALGSVAGSILGGMIGSKVGNAVNAQLDKTVKPKQSGRSLAW